MTTKTEEYPMWKRHLRAFFDPGMAHIAVSESSRIEYAVAPTLGEIRDHLAECQDVVPDEELERVLNRLSILQDHVEAGVTTYSDLMRLIPKGYTKGKDRC